MNRLYITELGDAMRNELKKQQEQAHVSTIVAAKSSLPDIKPTSGIAAMLMDADDNPLYRKSLSEVALLNLTKVANLSLYGSQCRDQLESHIREDLNINRKHDYLNMQLDKSVSRIVDDKNLKTRRKRQLLNELRKLESKPPFRQHTDQSQLSTIIEDHDRENKLMAIINTEGKLLQMQRRYQQQIQDDEAMKQQVRQNYSKYKEMQDMHIESLPILPTSVLGQGLGDLYHNKDLSAQRYQQRLLDKYKNEVKEWHNYHYPRRHKKWIRLQKKNENIK